MHVALNNHTSPPKRVCLSGKGCLPVLIDATNKAVDHPMLRSRADCIVSRMCVALCAGHELLGQKISSRIEAANRPVHDPGCKEVCVCNAVDYGDARSGSVVIGILPSEIFI